MYRNTHLQDDAYLNVWTMKKFLRALRNAWMQIRRRQWALLKLWKWHTPRRGMDPQTQNMGCWEMRKCRGSHFLFCLKPTCLGSLFRDCGPGRPALVQSVRAERTEQMRCLRIAPCEQGALSDSLHRGINNIARRHLFSNRWNPSAHPFPPQSPTTCSLLGVRGASL